jgi:hypothetical protein
MIHIVPFLSEQGSLVHAIGSPLLKLINRHFKCANDLTPTIERHFGKR